MRAGRRDATAGRRTTLGAGVLLAALLGLAAGAPGQSSPAGVSVSVPILGADGVIVTITWPGSTPASWASAYSDSAFFQNGTGTPPLALTLPYRTTASTAWVCVVTTCQTFAVPAQPAVIPEPTTHAIAFTEPSTRDCGGHPAPCDTTLDDLAEIRIYWRVDDGPEAMVSAPASGPTGGARREYTLRIPYTSGTLTVTLTARDRTGRESRRSAPASKVIGGAR